MPENNTPEPFVPQLTTRDWNDEWKQLQQARRRFDDADYWDKRSATFSTKDAPNPYVERFLELAGIEPGETVFDMGCGTGALSVPLGKRSIKVVAADFSRGMLDQLQAALDQEGVRSVFPKQMSWEDDWPSFGVRPGMVDVAVASRSVATADLRDSLLRLTDVARRRVCVTLATGTSPRTDERILNAIGLHSVLGRDHLYAFNILANEGLRPEVAYIDSTRTDTFDSADDAYGVFTRMVNDATATFIGEDERAAAFVRLRAWLADNLVSNEHVGQLDKKGLPEKALRLKEPRTVTWAFLAWNK
ncbi:class I SAM-dependent methyltransferase [Eggerthella sinensis]|uniref:Methyltransferase type 12 n=1 Tax=Eggerthella sinensis TaxID=242230 RepID=A0A3N0IXZ9_9ACTN|nr:methyltransferase domain-containing protein [Eggerthella sinensis]RDB65918.1 methyltransferase type 12 [Eggerthella sinensis]RNM41858.1 methyltransferase type 12 [Eggerthella sinensis]